MVRSVRVSLGFCQVHVHPVVSQQAMRVRLPGTGQTFCVPHPVSVPGACGHMHMRLSVGIPSSGSSWRLLLSCEVLLDHFLRDAAMFRDVGIEPSAGTNCPLQRGVVHCDDTEFRAQALDPLEVIHQGPVIVALYVYPVLDEPAHLEKVVVDVPGSEGVLGVGRAILSDEDGGMVAVPVLLADTIQPLRVLFPPEVVLLAVFPYFKPAQRVCGYGRTVHDVARIVVDAEEIEVATLAKRVSPTQRRQEPSLAHSCDKKLLKEPFVHACRPPSTAVAMFGIEQPEVIGNAIHRIIIAVGRTYLMDLAIGLDVCRDHVASAPEVLGVTDVARRPSAHDISRHEVDVRLVDGAPVTHEVAKVLGDIGCVSLKKVDYVRVDPRTRVFEPQWVREMVQCDKRPDSGVHQLLYLETIVADGVLVELPPCRLDAAPLQTHPIGLLMELLHECNVFSHPVPVIVSYNAAGTILDMTGLNPAIPAIVAITTLDLQRSCRRAQQETLWQCKWFHGHTSLSGVAGVIVCLNRLAAQLAIWALVRPCDRSGAQGLRLPRSLSIDRMRRGRLSVLHLRVGRYRTA